MESSKPVEDIMEYLSSGGLFNPELMDANKTRDLIIDSLDYIIKLEETIRFSKVVFQKLACLGSGIENKHGNSIGNDTAAAALKKISDVVKIPQTD